MPRPKKTAEEIHEMRERILDAAFALLQEEGLDGISIRRIADTVGVSHMSLYRYFESRAAIIKALRERGLEQMRAFCDASLRRAESGDALEEVRQSLNRFIELSYDHPRLYQLAWRRSSDDTSFRVDSRNLSGALGHLSRLIALAVERGQCAKRDPTLAAAMAFCIVNGTLMLYHTIAAVNQVDRTALEREMIEAAMVYLTQSEGMGG